MKRASHLLTAAAFAFASACHALPEPPPTEETAITPDAAPVVRIKVGGPCNYTTSTITATVVQTTENDAQLSQPDGRNFGLSLGAFEALNLVPMPGAEFAVQKRSIAQGTCVPFIYTLMDPAEAAPAN